MCHDDVEYRDFADELEDTNIACSNRRQNFQKAVLATTKKWSGVRWEALSDMITDFQVVARGYDHPDLFAPEKDWLGWEVAQVINITPSNMPLAVIAEIVYLREKISETIEGK